MENNILTVTPVKKYAAPKYPTSTDAMHTPELLRKLPSRWKKNAAVVTAIGLLGAMTLTSCGVLKSDTGTATASPTSIPDPTDIANYLNVAPVFVHGEGTGAIGCDMVVPPVFMSEEEALAIIRNEAESGGLNFNAAPPKYVATNNRAETNYSWDDQYVIGDGNVGLNLYDNESQVAVAYISMRSAEKGYLPKEDGNQMFLSIAEYRPRELAELIAEDFAKQKGDTAIGVLYEPGGNWESEEHQRILDEYNNSEKDWLERNAQYESDLRLLIEEELRAQVRDFIEWLQGQGII